eukprot:GHUV01020075.1.p3 GENE.GHUV01020075.1~~GHUV01020075.1.p3  ORF type:complete len:100 (+),score=13.38 GHUV01020075.1:1394-1693(+)
MCQFVWSIWSRLLVNGLWPGSLCLRKVQYQATSCSVLYAPQAVYQNSSIDITVAVAPNLVLLDRVKVLREWLVLARLSGTSESGCGLSPRWYENRATLP